MDIILTRHPVGCPSLFFSHQAKPLSDDAWIPPTTMKHSSLLKTFAAIATFGMVVTAACAEDPVSFRNDLAPILLHSCLGCHGPKTAEGGYRVDSFERAMKAGDSGVAGFSAGKLDQSEVFRRISSADVDERMPSKREPLTAEQMALFQRWIAEGARFDGDDPKAELPSIVPPPIHPAAPESYPFRLPIAAMIFSHDGHSLFVSGYHEITVWNPQDGKLLRRIGNVGQRTYALALSPDGKTLAVACGQPGRWGEARLFNPQTGELMQVLAATSDVVLDLAFNPKGDRLAIGTTDGAVRVFEVATGKVQLSILSHADWTTAVAWSSDGSKLASASRDKTAKVHDALSGELLASYAGHSESVAGVAFHPDGKDIYSSGADNRIHRWQIADAMKTVERGFNGEVFKLVAAGEFLFAASADKTVRQFDAMSHNPLKQMTGHKDSALSVAFHPGTKRLASGGFDGEIILWNLEDGNPILTFLAAPDVKAPQN